MSTFITGGNGFLGSTLLERLALKDYGPLRCLVRDVNAAGRLHSLRQQHPSLDLELVEGDLVGAPDWHYALRGAGTIIHVAAAMRGSTADMFANTVVGSRNLLDAAVRNGCKRILLVSSFAVYGTANMPHGTVVDENSVLENHPEKRDGYSYAKLRQEQLFCEYQQRHGFELVIIRPGVIYGPGGSKMSNRVGLQFPFVFLNFGGRNPLPLTYVVNCADAIVVAAFATHDRFPAIYNVHDDQLVSCNEYLRGYSRHVQKTRSIRVPYFALTGLARFWEWYSERSKGQLPAVLTAYKAATTWKRTRFNNNKLKALGWKPAVSTAEGLQKTWDYLSTLELKA